MFSVIALYLRRSSSLDGFVFPVSAKALNSLHANRQLGTEHAQVGADLAVENLPKLEIVELAQALSEQAGYQQRRLKTFRKVAGAYQRSLLFHEFADRQAVTRLSIRRRNTEWLLASP
jgi:hypothetical protein